MQISGGYEELQSGGGGGGRRGGFRVSYVALLLPPLSLFFFFHLEHAQFFPQVPSDDDLLQQKLREEARSACRYVSIAATSLTCIIRSPL